MDIFNNGEIEAQYNNPLKKYGDTSKGSGYKKNLLKVNG
jgi:hypothetical protein